MTYLSRRASAIDYMPCRYGSSKNTFRGPQRALNDNYIAIFGGSKTYGKFVDSPFAELLENLIEKDCINLGSMNAGIDVFMNDPVLNDVCNNARATVIEVMGAASLSNRFYKVHPRRNDRFIGVSALLKVVYQDVDFTDIHFVRHLLHTMQSKGQERFEIICEELQETWVMRMQLLLEKIDGPVFLLWFADHSPDDIGLAQIGADPLFVNRTMIEAIRPYVTEVLEVIPDSHDLEGMKFMPTEEPTAIHFPNPKAHEKVARALADPLKRLLRT